MDILNDIEEDLKNERYRRLWEKFGPWLIGGCVALVLATIIGVSVQHVRLGKAQEATALLMAATRNSNNAENLAIVAKKSGNVGALATIRLGQAALGNGKKEEAAMHFTAAAKQADNAPIQQFALLLGAYAAKGGMGAAKNNGAFAASQSELAAWQALQSGNIQEARQQFAALAEDENTPASMKTRLKKLLPHLPQPATDAGHAP